MSDSKCQRLDAISGRDKMAEKPPTEEASKGTILIQGRRYDVDKECLKRYQKNQKELQSLERILERLYQQLEDVPEVSGKVSKSSDDFPYIEQHVTVSMQEPKSASRIKDKIREKENRKKEVLSDMARAERIVVGIPEGLTRQIMEQVYLEGMSQQEVGEAIGYTKGRISQLISRATKD